MTRQRKKIHSAFTQFHTNVFNFFENLLHFVFSRKNKNSLGSAHRISFSGCVFKENIFLHFSLRNSEKVRKKIFTLIFFYSVPHIIFSVTDFLRENITFHSVSHTELFYQEKKNSLRKTKKTNTFSLWEIIFFSLVPTPNKKNNSERNFLYFFFHETHENHEKKLSQFHTKKKTTLLNRKKHWKHVFFPLEKSNKSKS